MMSHSPARRPRQSKQSGAAMLIAIFALLLISVVAIALVVSSGTDASLAGNYRTASSAYYAGVAGLEEARGRLLWKNPNYINISNSYSSLLSSAGLPTWGLTQVLYILNPNTSAGETVDPTNAANPYYDSEYSQEFPGWGLAGATMQTPLASVSPVVASNLPGPAYKWVRINPVTEQSLNMDVNGDGVIDSASVLFYDPAHVNSSNQAQPSLVSSSVPSIPPTPTSVQALEITTLAVAPNGGKRLLQYVVAPLIISPDATDQHFPAALTLDTGVTGASAQFQSPSGVPSYFVDGRDQGCPANPLQQPALPAPATPTPIQSVAYTNSGDYSTILAAANLDSTGYPGAPVWNPPPGPGYTTPSILNSAQAGTILRQSWMSPATLDSIMQDVVNSADVVVTGPATGDDILSQAPAVTTNPMTIVVNGDLSLSGWHHAGNGLLLVTGTLNYDPDANWNGIMLVVGQGIFSSTKNGTGGINGAVFVAKTRDASGNLLSALGSAFYGSQTSFGSQPGTGICYNSPAVSAAQGPLSYKILSFHEIPLPN
jgi:hypothetical protein